MKIYVCFIDLRKAFDSVLHPALMLKLIEAGVGGNFFRVLKSMYSNIELKVKTDKYSLSDAFPSSVGVFQGDNLSPNLFNLFIDGIVKSFDSSCEPVTLGSKLLNGLLYADDLLLISESTGGLQNCLNKVYDYCNNWGLDINYKKTKVMIFNKGSRLVTHTFFINNVEIECVGQYKYLGVLFTLNGSFKEARIDLHTRGQQHFFKLTSLFNNVPCDIKNGMYIFDHTVKHVVLYSSEILGIFNTNSKSLDRNSDNLFEGLFGSQSIEKNQSFFM